MQMKRIDQVARLVALLVAVHAGTVGAAGGRSAAPGSRQAAGTPRRSARS